MHPTADTLLVIFGNHAGRRVMPGVRLLSVTGMNEYANQVSRRGSSYHGLNCYRVRHYEAEAKPILL
jgi:hypothetical protein